MVTFTERSACPSCGGEDFHLLKALPFDDPTLRSYLERYYEGRVPVLGGAAYKLCRCAVCGLVFQQAILDEAGMQALYDSWIGTADSQNKRETTPLRQRVGYVRQALQVIHTLGLPAERIHVLDFGMGWGHWLLAVRALGLQAYGLELSQERRRYALGLGLRVVDNIAEQSMDMVNAEQVLEHVPEPAQLVRAMYNWLRPGGLLRLAVPNGQALESQLRAGTWSPDYMPSIPLEHINVFTPASLRQMAERCGFQAIQPALVLPPLGLSWGDVRQFVGVLGASIAARLGLYRSTTQWFRKG